jgi:hypothetical protein
MRFVDETIEQRLPEDFREPYRRAMALLAAFDEHTEQRERVAADYDATHYQPDEQVANAETRNKAYLLEREPLVKALADIVAFAAPPAGRPSYKKGGTATRRPHKRGWHRTNSLFLVTVREPRDRDLTALFNMAEDWVSYAPGCWIVRTSETSAAWAKRLDEATDPEAAIVVTKFGHMAGSIPQAVWDWLEKNGLRWGRGFDK